MTSQVRSHFVQAQGPVPLSAVPAANRDVTGPPVRLWLACLIGSLLAAGMQHALSAPPEQPTQATEPAPAVLIVAAGATRGTYFDMMRSLHQVCGRDRPRVKGTPLVLRSTSGSLESLSLLQNGQAQLAIVSADTLQARSAHGALEELERVATLHEEKLHVIVARQPDVGQIQGLAAWRARLGRRFGLGAVLQMGDLAGTKVGSWGGSQLTAARMLAALGVQAEVQDLGSEDQAFRALDEGKISAVMAVGGAPLPWVLALPKNQYRLLPVPLPAPATPTGSSLYHRSALRYDNLGLQEVDTVAVDALLLARRYRKSESRVPLLLLRACLARELDGLADQHHPAWRTVVLQRDPGLAGLADLSDRLEPGGAKLGRALTDKAARQRDKGTAGSGA